MFVPQRPLPCLLFSFYYYMPRSFNESKNLVRQMPDQIENFYKELARNTIPFM